MLSQGLSGVYTNMGGFALTGGTLQNGQYVAITRSFDASSLTNNTRLQFRTNAPTPAQIGAGNGWLWASNGGYLYYSYTANGSTSNNAVKIAP